LETVMLRDNRVHPGKKIVNAVTTESVGGRRAREPSLIVACLDGSARNRCRFLVANVAE
jgi:hypothetical protein